MTITLTREEAQQVLDALAFSVPQGYGATEIYGGAIALIDSKLSAPEPEPVMLMDAPLLLNGQPLYTAPPQREWQGLTDEEMLDTYAPNRIPDSAYSNMGEDLKKIHDAAKEEMLSGLRAIEAKLREKNA